MYVNDRTIDYRQDGRDSIKLFLQEGQKIGLIDQEFDTANIEFIGAV
jgi:predicted solute-binding protein